MRPSRQDLVLALFKVMMEVFQGLKIPVVVAFDQLEDLLLARRTDDGHRIAEAFFAGIVQAMHQIDGICFLIFAERGLWNRFVPSLDGYIQDRLNNPIHLPEHGTIKALRLEAPPPDLVRQRGRSAAAAGPGRIARLRRSAGHLPVHRRAGRAHRPHRADAARHAAAVPPPVRSPRLRRATTNAGRPPAEPIASRAPVNPPARRPRCSAAMAKPVTAVEMQVGRRRRTATAQAAATAAGRVRDLATSSWEQEDARPRRKLEPEGALTGATRELQAGLGTFLQICHEHGVKVGPVAAAACRAANGPSANTRPMAS